MKPDTNYTFERVSIHNVKDLVPIFLSAFGQKVKVEQLESKMNTSFAGASYIGYVAYAEDKSPVAFYGVFPVEVLVAGKVFLVAQSGDTMTDPKHQGKGLFVRLATKTYELCKQEGILGVFGFPSASSYPGFTKKLLWLHQENIEKFTLWVPSLPVGELSRFSPTLQKLHLRACTWLLQKWPKTNSYLGSVLGAGNDGINRTNDYLRYKMRNNDVFQLQVKNGKVVTLKLSHYLGIGDMELREFKSTIRQIRWLAFLLGYNRIVCYASPRSALAVEFKRYFKPVIGLPIGYINFSPKVDLAQVQYTYMDFDTF